MFRANLGRILPEILAFCRIRCIYLDLEQAPAKVIHFTLVVYLYLNGVKQQTHEASKKQKTIYQTKQQSLASSCFNEYLGLSKW